MSSASWLLEPTDPSSIFTPEQLTEEHRLISRTAQDFLRQEVLTHLDELEAKNWAVARGLLQQCGTLGLLGVDVPEVYGGVDLDKVSSVVVAEAVAGDASFATTFGAMTGLVIVPLMLFGTEEQRTRYLPRLVSG